MRFDVELVCLSFLEIFYYAKIKHQIVYSTVFFVKMNIL
jgi:hypothetical protein